MLTYHPGDDDDDDGRSSETVSPHHNQSINVLPNIAYLTTGLCGEG
jgi:hypothetical protein